MTIETFNPPIQPSTGARKKPTIKILEAEFGDGYTQSCPDGINYLRQSFDLVWEVLTHNQSDYIESFFEARGGVEHFHWTAPGDSSPKKWTCKDWEVTYNRAGFRSIKATLKQSFNLT